MPRRRFIDKKNATTFALVHRAQNDPLIHDENAPSMVFAEKQSIRMPTQDGAAYSSTGSVASEGSEYRSQKTRQRGDLEDEFGLSFRANEGEAAQHGVFFDDTEYDYMQHMRDLGAGEGPVMWVEAGGTPEQKERKGKQRLEDALQDMDLGADAHSVGGQSTISSKAQSLLPDDVLPSEFVRQRTYQDQQDVPDEIAGFQPDMDPRLREVLEALDDEEYVDDEENIFAELTQEGVEVDINEWERMGEQQMFEDGEGELDNEDGWESDDTIKAASPPLQASLLRLPEECVSEPPEDTQAQLPADPTEGAWIDEFKKFKSDTKSAKAAPGRTVPIAPSSLPSSALSSLASGRRKKRKGAKTSTTNYSMTSSALARTDQQTLLDARFDKIEEEYGANEVVDEEDGPMNDMSSVVSAMTGASKGSKGSRYSNVSALSGRSGISSYSRAADPEIPQLERSDFNSIMDEFLGGYSKVGKSGRRVKVGGSQTGMEQLDEIRSGLGPARVKGRTAAKAS